MVVKLNTVRLNGASLNHASLNGVGERLRASAGGGGGEVIPPDEPDVPVVPVTYILSASASNGVVSASVNGNAVTLPYTANEGDVVIVEVTANDGYEFEGWSDGSTDNPRSITMTADVTLSATCVEQVVESNYIQFEDKAVEAICVANWSSDGIGLTEEDAAAVTSIGKWFKGNTDITSFDEFEFFKGVTSLEYGAFQGCTSLQEIALPTGCTTLADGSVNYGSFRDCSSLRKVVADGLTSLGYGVFQNCSALSDLRITWANVTKINTQALIGCTALSFDFLNLLSLETLGTNALNGVKIKKLNLGKVTSLPPASNSSQNFGKKDVLEEVVLHDTLVEIPGNSFHSYNHLHTINIPSTITKIGPLAFYGCTSLTSADLSNVVTIDSQAFDLYNGRMNLAGNVNLTNCETIGNYAFRNCRLSLVDIGTAISSIGSFAFANNDTLDAILCRAITPPTLAATNALQNTNNCPIYVPDAALEVYKTATNWTTYADRIHPLSELEGSPYITFADAEVERVLMENNVSSDGVGITMADA